MIGTLSVDEIPPAPTVDSLQVVFEAEHVIVFEWKCSPFFLMMLIRGVN